MEKEIVRIIDVNDTEVDVELISILENDGNKYMVYTKGEKQKSGNYIVYISRLKASEGVYHLENIYDNEEWTSVKELLKSIL